METKAKRNWFYTGIGIGSLLAVTLVITKGHAVETPLPMKMEHADVLELRGALAEIRALQAEANLKAAPFVATRDEVCKRYKILPEQLGVSVGIDEDGTIHRQGMEAPPALTAPAPATPKPEAKEAPKAPPAK